MLKAKANFWHGKDLKVKKGDCFDCDPEVAKLLVQRGLAEGEPEQKPEAPIEEPKKSKKAKAE